MVTNATMLKSLLKLQKAYEAGKLQEHNACRYQDQTGKCCAVGYLMTPEMRKKVIGAGSNGERVSTLFFQDAITKPVILLEEFELTTGLNLAMASTIQVTFDNGSYEFKKFLKEEIERLSASPER